jgi:heterodisulfide reductase subunit C
MVTKGHAAPSSDLLQAIINDTPHGERLLHCLQCGSCGGSCPSGADMDYTPRAIFALMAAGDEDAVMTSNTMWMCVSCYLCTVRCPQQIPITDIIYALKRRAIATQQIHNTEAPALAATFTDFVDRYGRSFEFGLASRFYLLNKPSDLLKMGPLGLSLFRRGRLGLKPTRIKQIDQLEAIIAKARRLGAAK